MEINYKKCCAVAIFALILSLVAYSLANEAINTNDVFNIVVNNTNKAPTIDPSSPGTGERVTGNLYYTNDSAIELFVFAHAMVASDTAEIHLHINGTIVAVTSGRPLGAAESSNKTIIAIIPKGSNYTVEVFNFHHYEWREYPILSGKNGTLSINQTIIQQFGSNISSFINETAINNSIASINETKVNKSGDNMTGRLSIGNSSFATSGELFVVQGTSSFVRLESNNTQGAIFFGARYRGDMNTTITPVMKNDIIFRVSGIGTKANDSYTSTPISEMRIVAAGDFSNTYTPSQIEFVTSSNTTPSVISKKWIIEPNGSIVPGVNNLYSIGNDTFRVRNISAVLPAETSTLDAVCTDGVKLFFNPGLATCTASTELFKRNITDVSANMVNMFKFKLKTYDYTVSYHDADTDTTRLKTYTRYGLIAQDVENIDPKFVGYDSNGNITGIRYEDLTAYLINVTQQQQTLLNKICSKNQTLCS